jgi:hypothetical protein
MSDYCYDGDLNYIIGLLRELIDVSVNIDKNLQKLIDSKEIANQISENGIYE